MTRPARSTEKRRLESAGYVHVSGWVPEGDAPAIQAMIAPHRDEAQRIAAEPRPLGTKVRAVKS